MYSVTCSPEIIGFYSTFGNCGHFAPHRSLILRSDFFFGQSGGEFFQPINKFAVAATLVDQLGETIATIAPAFVTGHAQHIELADQIAEDDCAVVGHCGSPQASPAFTWPSEWIAVSRTLVAAPSTCCGFCAMNARITSSTSVRLVMGGMHFSHQ